MLTILSTETTYELRVIMRDYGILTPEQAIRDLIHREFVEMTEAETLRNEGG